MKLRILFHDHCLDGACSAALFARFHGERVTPGAEIELRGLSHALGDAFGPDAFDAATDEHACVDFRYSPHPALSWWFDHHVSAFSSAADRGHFDAAPPGHKFFDPLAPSCTGFIARVLAAEFDYRADDLAETVRWTDIVDSARFDDAQSVVAMAAPALELAAFLEASRDHAERAAIIRELMTRPLEEIVRLPLVRGPVAILRARRDADVARVRRYAQLADDVVVYDLLDGSDEPVNKFIPYALFPGCRYAVGLQRGDGKLKISVGQNPWAPTPGRHHVATLCERHGGGGHAAVGGVTLPERAVDEARAAVADIAAALRRDPEP